MFLIVGVLVYIRSPKNPINFYFGLASVLISIWVTIGLVWNIQIQQMILPDLTSRCGVATGSIVTASLVAFSSHFPIKSIRLTLKWIIANYVLACLIAASAFTPWSVKDAYFDDGEFIREFGPLYRVFTFYVILSAVHIFANFIVKYRRLTHVIEKQKVKYVAFGLTLMMPLIIFFMFVLPYFGIQEYFFLGEVAPLFMVGFSAYAILRYRALDISAIASKLIIWLINICVMFAIIYVNIYFFRDYMRAQSTFMISIYGLFICSLIIFYFRKIRPQLDGLLQRRAINMSRVLEDFSTELNQLQPLAELSLHIEENLKRIIEVDNVSILLRDMTKGYVLLSDRQERLINHEDFKSFLSFLERNDEIIEKEEIILDPRYGEIRDEALQYFDTVEAGMVIPLVFNKHLQGVLHLGEKLTGETYSPLEYQLLSILRHDIGVALNNSQLYQKVNDLFQQVTTLNETLEQRVTERTADLQEALSKLKHLDKMKSDFISVASHELRTPLTAVKGAISLSLEYELDGEVGKVVRHFLEMSNRNLDRLVRLINDLLDLSKLESSQYTLKIEPIEIGAIFKGAIEALQPLIHKKKIWVKDHSNEGKIILRGDRERLQQVAVNLIGNAIKYSPQTGEIVIRVTYDTSGIECSVFDQGEGIPLDSQAKIFEKFGQSRDAENKEDGTGLGLAISKKIVEMHNGRIWVESHQGQGSIFKFYIPFDIS